MQTDPEAMPKQPRATNRRGNGDVYATPSLQVWLQNRYCRDTGSGTERAAEDGVSAPEKRGPPMSYSNGKYLDKVARCAALLRDGPLTAPGAAEMLGVHQDSVTQYFKAFKRAGLAKVASERKNPSGKNTPIWEFVNPDDQP